LSLQGNGHGAVAPQTTCPGMVAPPRAPTAVPQRGDKVGVQIRPCQLLNPNTLAWLHPSSGGISRRLRSQPPAPDPAPHGTPTALPTPWPLPIPPGGVLHEGLGSLGELGQAFFFPHLLYIWVHIPTQSAALK